MQRNFIICLFLLISIASTLAQGQQGYFQDIELKTDTAKFSLNNNRVVWQGEPYLYFTHSEKQIEAELYCYPVNYNDQEQVRLVNSTAFEEVDSLVWLGKYYKTKIRFNNLIAAQSVSLVFEVSQPDSKASFYEVKLFNNQIPVIQITTGNNEDFYIGEIKEIPLNNQFAEYIKTSSDWANTPKYDYRFMNDHGLKLQILPKESGKLDISIVPISKKYFLSKEGDFTNRANPITISATVKQTRLQFLTVDRPDIPIEFTNARGIEIQLENSRNLQLKKTYRIEDQSEPGGIFIGEIYTRGLLNNDKILCWFRPFSLHRLSEGYLYIKDGDEAKFITNINILPKFSITKVSLLREGADWNSNLTANPGESVELKIEGSGLNRAVFKIDEAQDFKLDTARSGEAVQVIKFKIPGNVSKRKLGIYKNGNPIGSDILVKEFQKPRSLDFVSINYGDSYIPITNLVKPVLYDKSITDLSLKFNPDLIDNVGKLYGKQYLSITINLFNNRRELLESRVIDNYVVCPSDVSPRSAFYDSKDCQKGNININNYISRKTYDLADWSRIEVIIKHKETQYSDPGFTQRVELILQKHSSFDIEVSFPGGLLIQRIGNNSFANFGGVSLAILGQFSFYKPNEVEKLRPYKLGAGIIALNAFNFSSNNTTRDLGIVAIGSLYPIQTKSKLKFPLFLGFGYFLQEEKWFYLVGPGIQLSF
jgi:hypothetical protein